MTSAMNLLETLRQAGISLRVEGADLMASPAGRLTPELRAALRGRKAELLAFLADDGRQAALDAYDADEPPTRPVELRQAVLLELEPGKWLAVAPALLDLVARWNAEAREKWLKRNPCER